MHPKWGTTMNKGGQARHGKMSLEEQSQALETVETHARHTAHPGLTASEDIHEADAVHAINDHERQSPRSRAKHPAGHAKKPSGSANAEAPSGPREKTQR